MKKIGSDTTKTFMANTADAVSQIVRWIINLAPFGIMGLVYTNVSGNGLAIFTQYGKLLALLVGTMLFMALIVPLHHVYLSGLQPYRWCSAACVSPGPDRLLSPAVCRQHPREHGPLCEKLGLDKGYVIRLHPAGCHHQHGVPPSPSPS